MIVYHGSDAIVKTPDLLHSAKRLDFGVGFYVTTVKEQAERWAKRKAAIHGKQRGFVNVYEMTLSSAQHIMDFSEGLETWIDFVCDCRNGSDEYLKYDIIKGKVANDKVFRVVDMYKRGIWDKVRAIQEIRVYKTYDQIAFISQKAIDSSLKFQKSIEVVL
ncbi:DUF3990 domain-containing protein [Ruminococcus flavefaciens]|uniref:DUF3990 domain-containing protein n=1 Tax=Ruminococcus flavefaciens TaxID=1265 RepID=UPI001563247E|nr:DUF3990 domain-containing protein [Ruminococcus flavefaciens]